MNNTKNQSEFVPMPLSKLKEHLQSQMNNFGLDKIMDEWKVKTVSDGWKSKYDVIVIKRMRIGCISITFGISQKHFGADAAGTINDSKGDRGSFANLKSIITNIDSYDSLYNKYKIKIMKT